MSLEAGRRKRRQWSHLECWQCRQCSSLFRIVKYLETNLFFGEPVTVWWHIWLWIVGFQLCPVDFLLKCEKEVMFCFTSYTHVTKMTPRDGFLKVSLSRDCFLKIRPCCFFPLRAQGRQASSGWRKHHSGYEGITSFHLLPLWAFERRMTTTGDLEYRLWKNEKIILFQHHMLKIVLNVY